MLVRRQKVLGSILQFFRQKSVYSTQTYSTNQQETLFFAKKQSGQKKKTYQTFGEKCIDSNIRKIDWGSICYCKHSKHFCVSNESNSKQQQLQQGKNENKLSRMRSQTGSNNSPKSRHCWNGLGLSWNIYRIQQLNKYNSGDNFHCNRMGIWRMRQRFIRHLIYSKVFAYIFGWFPGNKRGVGLFCRLRSLKLLRRLRYYLPKRTDYACR